MPRRVKKIPEWLRGKTPEFSETEGLNDHVTCSLHQGGKLEKGRLYFTTNHIVYSGTSSHIVVKNSKASSHTDGKHVVLKADDKKYVLAPEEPRQCESISRAILRAARSSEITANTPQHRPQDDVSEAGMEHEDLESNDERDEDDEQPLPASYQIATEKLLYTTVQRVHFGVPSEVKGSKLVGSFVIPSLSLSQVRDVIFSDSSTFMSAYHKKLGDVEPTVPKWTVSNPAEKGGTRMFTCKTQTPFGVTPFNESQRYTVHKSGDSTIMTYQGSAQCPKASFGETFRVQTLLEFVPEKHGVRVSFYGMLKWAGSKPSLVGRVIEESVATSLPKSFQAFKEIGLELASRVKPQGNNATIKKSSRGPSNASFSAPHRSATPPPQEPVVVDENSSAPSKAPEASGLPLVLAAIAVLLCVMYLWSSRSLGRAEEKLENVKEHHPDYVFQMGMERLAARRGNLMKLKSTLTSLGGGGLAALSSAEKHDIYKRITELKTALRPYHAQHEGGKQRDRDVQQQGKPAGEHVADDTPEQNGVPAQPPRAPPPSGVVHNSQQQQHSQCPQCEDCGSVASSLQARHAAEVAELRKLLTEQGDRMYQEQHDTLFRLRLLTVIATISFCFTIRQLVSMVSP
eukprot:TRINITY_DN6477_c1_g2_i1.p1 TRINITY_DN6477_c1_g2~~TRINITY_DN6477_c1_g2_i1.p1  ORF type:complete len:638 (+),score=82.59 TRINITY_DN6477_c1_g2_i1:35-1915(+)